MAALQTFLWLINWLTHPLVKISLWRRHALMVGDGASSHKIDYVIILKGIQMALLVQELRQFCWMGGLCLLVKLHREGSAPAGLIYTRRGSPVEEWYLPNWIIKNTLTLLVGCPPYISLSLSPYRRRLTGCFTQRSGQCVCPQPHPQWALTR